MINIKNISKNISGFWKVLGPGLVIGASDDDSVQSDMLFFNFNKLRTDQWDMSSHFFVLSGFINPLTNSIYTTEFYNNPF